MRSQQNVKRREYNWAEELIGSEEASIITTEKEGRLTYWIARMVVNTASFADRDSDI